MVNKQKLPIRWDRLAKDNLDAIYDYIAEDSVLAARKVKKELVNNWIKSDLQKQFPIGSIVFVTNNFAYGIGYDHIYMLQKK